METKVLSKVSSYVKPEVASVPQPSKSLAYYNQRIEELQVWLTKSNLF